MPRALRACGSLADGQGMNAYGSKDLGGVRHASREAVRAALSALGARDEDVRIEASAAPPPVHCPGVLVTAAEPPAAVSLYGPAYRLNPKDRPELGDELRDLVERRAPDLLGI